MFKVTSLLLKSDKDLLFLETAVFVKFIPDARTMASAVKLAKKRLCLPEDAVQRQYEGLDGEDIIDLVLANDPNSGYSTVISITEVDKNIAKMLKNGKSNVINPIWLTSAAD